MLFIIFYSSFFLLTTQEASTALELHDKHENDADESQDKCAHAEPGVVALRNSICEIQRKPDDAEDEDQDHHHQSANRHAPTCLSRAANICRCIRRRRSSR